MSVLNRAACCALHKTWLKYSGHKIQCKQPTLLQVGLCVLSRAGLQSCCLMLCSCNKWVAPTRLLDALLMCLPTRCFLALLSC